MRCAPRIAAAEIVMAAARVGILLAHDRGRVWAQPNPPAQMAAEIGTHRADLLPLLLPASCADWPKQWRDLFEERRDLDQRHYDLTPEAAGFVAEGWVRLAYARWVAGHPPAGGPWADLAVDDLLLVVSDSRAEGVA